MSVQSLIACFPDAEILRERDGDIVYRDRDFYPHCGFMSLREVAILSDVAAKVGGEWLEIGTHVGFSAACLIQHIEGLLCVDPELVCDTPIDVRFWANIRRAGCKVPVFVQAIQSEQFFVEWGSDGSFDGVLIDGCHDAPVPLNDAIGADRVLNPGGVIVLHDSRGQPVKDAVNWLERQGYRVERHDTMNGLAVCWKPKAAA